MQSCGRRQRQAISIWGLEEERRGSDEGKLHWEPRVSLVWPWHTYRSHTRARMSLRCWQSVSGSFFFHIRVLRFCNLGFFVSLEYKVLLPQERKSCVRNTLNFANCTYVAFKYSNQWILSQFIWWRKMSND